MAETSDIEDSPGEPSGESAADSAASASGGSASAPAPDGERFVYHLYLEAPEAAVAASALRLLIADEAHEPTLRGLARDALQKVSGEPEANGILTVPLSPQEMKISHTAFRLLLDDLQREQADERHLLQRILQKLPDEHAIRAIVLE